VLIGRHLVYARLCTGVVPLLACRRWVGAVVQAALPKAVRAAHPTDGVWLRRLCRVHLAFVAQRKRLFAFSWGGYAWHRTGKFVCGLLTDLALSITESTERLGCAPYGRYTLILTPRASLRLLLRFAAFPRSGAAPVAGLQGPPSVSRRIHAARSPTQHLHSASWRGPGRELATSPEGQSR